jgi:DNA-directed RNA polymerase specialized sigma24 family protein
MNDVTHILSAIERGDPKAAGQLLPLVYDAQEVLALHEALEQLAAHDPVKAKLVEMRFFAGLTLEQAAECLGIAPRTADRAWRYARAWLYAAMAGPDSGEK